MIINIRGTSGSGKTTLARKIMARYQYKVRVKNRDPRRSKLEGYILHNGPGTRPLAVVGHYESECGGCDTLPDMATVFERVMEAHNAGMDVLFEGLLISSDVNRILALHKCGVPLQAISLSTSLRDCLASVQERRNRKAVASGTAAKPFNPKQTTSKYKSVLSAYRRLKDARVPIVLASREDAERLACERLGLPVPSLPQAA